MELATILPTRYLHMTTGDHVHMALAHLVGVDEEYTNHFKRLDKETNYLILDNSVIEDAQQTIEQVCEKAVAIGAHEIILIDKFKDMAGTLDASFDSLKYVREHYPQFPGVHVVLRRDYGQVLRLHDPARCDQEPVPVPH